MHEAGREFFSAPWRTPDEQAYIARRRALSKLTGREECALFSMDIYADDECDILYIKLRYCEYLVSFDYV